MATGEEKASVRVHNQTSLTGNEQCSTENYNIRDTVLTVHIAAFAGNGQLEQCGRVGRMDYWMCLRIPVTQLHQVPSSLTQKNLYTRFFIVLNAHSCYGLAQHA